MTNTLCTTLPDLPPAGTAERIYFVSARRSDWCHDGDLEDFHQAFLADGLPYTVQCRPAAEPFTLAADSDWGPDEREALLTVQARNPSLCS